MPDKGISSRFDGSSSSSAACLILSFVLIGVMINAGRALPTGSAVLEDPLESNLAFPESSRFLVTPRTPRANAILRQMPGIDIHHEFNGSFSAEIHVNKMPVILAVADVTEIKILDLHAPQDLKRLFQTTWCGDGKCEAEETDSCPGDCGAFKIRTCMPSKQTDYNIKKAGGGGIWEGKGVNVAIIDTGAKTAHLDIKSNVKMCVDTTKVGVRNGCDDVSGSGHGTHTAGIIGANSGNDKEGMIGMAPSANLMIVKACSTDHCYEDDIVEGISYAASRGANIILLPFGSETESDMITKAVKSWPDILFIASAGNFGPRGVAIQYPARIAEVLAVGAIDQNDAVVWFSARGYNDGDDSTVTDGEIELVAGGSNVESINVDGCYSKASGTSYSAATVAGLAAKVWDISDGELDGKGNARSARRYMATKAKDITIADGGGADAGFDIASGYGSAGES